MPSICGVEFLGRAPETCPSLKKSCGKSWPNAVESAPLANCRRMEFGAPTWELDCTDEKERDAGFRMQVAADLGSRERAFRLAYREYRESGYARGNEDGRLVSNFDADPRTLILLIQDRAGQDAATISLVFDSPAGLPCDQVYALDLVALRSQERRLVEVTRLAIDRAYAGAKTLLVQLFNFISVYARNVEAGTDFIIEVNPRHVNYYRRLLLFEPLGPERSCPRVNGAPAVLMRLDLAAQAKEIGCVGGTQGQARGPHGRTLYSHFCTLAQEERVAKFLMRQQRGHSRNRSARSRVRAF